MSDVPKTPRPSPDPGPPVGDPPPKEKPVKTSGSMRDPFTEQTTHPAGEGQGANRSDAGAGTEPAEDNPEATPLERGFSPVP